MSVLFNHTIIAARDRRASAAFVARLFGLPAPTEWGPFTILSLADGVLLQFAELPVTGIQMQHYAFLVDDATFDALLARLQARDIEYAADPRWTKPGEIYTNDGGRGVSFFDPAGHGPEAFTWSAGAARRRSQLGMGWTPVATSRRAGGAGRLPRSAGH